MATWRGAFVPVRKCATGALTPEADQAESQNMKECRALSRQWLTPKMSGLLDRIGRAQRQSLDQMGPEAAKRHYELAAEVLDLPRAPLARVLDLQVPVRDGSGRPARLYAPSLEPLPVLLYLHGGGFTVGSLETHDSLCRQIALRAGVAVLALDYRLAPEHRFPVAVHDAQDGLAWLRGAASTLGLQDRFAVGGDSAGATLAAVLAILARDAGWPLALQVLITPGTCAWQDTASHRLFSHGFLLDHHVIQWFFRQYIDDHDRHDWRFAPLEADDLSGLAPAWIGLAECDPLVDEGQAYADRLRMHGVAVELDLRRGVTHDFIKMGRVLPEASQALDHLAHTLKEALHAQPQ